MEEPSVLDYLKSKLMPWKGRKIEIPAPDEIPAPAAVQSAPMEAEEPPTAAASVARPVYHWPWRMLLALVLAVAAQRLLEPAGERSATVSAALYLMAAAFAVWALIAREWQPVVLQDEVEHPMVTSVQRNPLLFGVPLLVLTFIAFGGDRFTTANLLLWGLTIFFVLSAFWVPGEHWQPARWREKINVFLRAPQVHIHISGWTFLLLAVLAVAAFFRFYRLGQVPGEMFSDHAEKLLDVGDVLAGRYSVFFPRNTGREFIQFYLTAAIILIFKTGLTFISLKLGTALCGFLTLPYIYRLGKEIGNRWVGLLAMLMAAFAYWPNVISRIGLRFPLYPLFVAPVLFYLIRGLRRANRNDFILSGLFLGLGLHGYSPTRFLPFVVVAGVLVYLLHRQAQGKRWQALWALAVLAFVSLVIFVPLLRYAQQQPEMFGLRAISRLGTSERPFPAPVWQIFLSNTWKASIMFFWDNGNIWVHSIPGRPALDVISAALFFLGTVLVVARYVRQRNWVDLFLLISIPLLMMPSILSLAFPEENPSLNRTGGAIIPVFIIIAIALEALVSGLMRRARSGWGRGIAVAVGLILVVLSARQNFDLVFNKFDDQFMNGAWNTSEIGQVIRGYIDADLGTPDSAYVVPFPYWVDTRLVGINAGYPTRDYAIWPDQFAITLDQPGNKLFILKSDDSEDLEKLKALYPHGVSSLHKAAREGKDYIVFLVPAEP